MTRLFSLPKDVLDIIYSYDGTYREHMKSHVHTELWYQTWANWKNRFLDQTNHDPRMAILIAYLFDEWKCCMGSRSTRITTTTTAFHRSCFPSDLYIRCPEYRNLEFTGSTLYMEEDVDHDSITSITHVPEEQDLAVLVILENEQWRLPYMLYICNIRYLIGNTTFDRMTFVVYEQGDYEIRVIY